MEELGVQQHRTRNIKPPHGKDPLRASSLVAGSVVQRSAVGLLLDSLADGTHQIVIEGPSYRARLAPRYRRTPDCRYTTRGTWPRVA
jgi:hypothetical protein